MAWDRTLPDGDLSIAQGDDAIRDNNDAIEDAFDYEHEFTTGGDQGGTHTFYYGTSGGLNAGTGRRAQGAIGFETTARGVINPVMREYDGSTWLQLDVAPSGNAVPHVNDQEDWTVTQNVRWDEITIVAATPDQCAIDMDLSSYQYAEITDDTIIQNPTNVPTSGYGTTINLVLTVNSVTSPVITWDTSYVTAGGLTPGFSAGNGDVNIFSLVYLQTGFVAVGAVPGLTSVV